MQKKTACSYFEKSVEIGPIVEAPLNENYMYPSEHLIFIFNQFSPDLGIVFEDL